MKLGHAMEVLGLIGTALAELTNEQVKDAFRHQMKISHPDTTTAAMGTMHLRPDVVWTADSIKEARDTLLNRRNVNEFACKTCNGTGKVRYRMGTRPCVPCKGTGDTNGC